MEPYYEGFGVVVYHGNCLDVMRQMPPASVDAVVTDPPYSISFMGHGWDSHGDFQRWCAAWATECLRVLKPGGHMVAFGAPRTYHRMACGIEDAGFEVRDCLLWLYSQGMPKGLNVSKAIDRAAGATREVVGSKLGRPGYSLAPSTGMVPYGNGISNTGDPEKEVAITAPATMEAQRWDGWNTSLRPSYEPIVLARKPLDGSVAQNVMAHGTGAINVGACRIDDGGAGRWPANVMLDEGAAAMLDEQVGTLTSGANPTRRSSDKFRNAYGDFKGQAECVSVRGANSGGPSRFFYTAKADGAERPSVDGVTHATVKPLAIMQFLARLVIPPDGIALDPFAGSGTTAEACLLEGFTCIAIEKEADYLPLIVARITRQRDPVAHVKLVGDSNPTLFDLLD